MLVTCQRFGDLFFFGLVWQYSSVQTKYNKGMFKVMANRWVSVSEFQSPAYDIGKNTCFAYEWQWFHNSVMSKGLVIGNQRFGKVTK